MGESPASSSAWLQLVHDVVEASLLRRGNACCTSRLGGREDLVPVVGGLGVSFHAGGGVRSHLRKMLMPSGDQRRGGYRLGRLESEPTVAPWKKYCRWAAWVISGRSRSSWL